MLLSARRSYPVFSHQGSGQSLKAASQGLVGSRKPGDLKGPEASDFGGNRTPCSSAITHPFLLGLIVSVFTPDQGTPLIFCDLHSKWHHSGPLKFKKAGLMNHKLQANWLRNPSHLTTALPRPQTPKDGRSFPGCFWKGAQRGLKRVTHVGFILSGDVVCLLWARN